MILPRPIPEVRANVDFKLSVGSELEGKSLGSLNVTKPGREKARRNVGQTDRISSFRTYWAPFWQLQYIYWEFTTILVNKKGLVRGWILAGVVLIRRSMQCRTWWRYEKVGVESETNRFLRCFGDKLVTNIS